MLNMFHERAVIDTMKARPYLTYDQASAIVTARTRGQRPPAVVTYAAPTDPTAAPSDYTTIMTYMRSQPGLTYEEATEAVRMGKAA
jgi:hypothetical protein